MQERVNAKIVDSILKICLVMTLLTIPLTVYLAGLDAESSTPLALKSHLRAQRIDMEQDNQCKQDTQKQKR